MVVTRMAPRSQSRKKTCKMTRALVHLRSSYFNNRPYLIGEVEVQIVRVINRRMTTMSIDERVVCRSIISVKLITVDVSLNKGHIVMRNKNWHGELLIEMEDNIYCTVGQ